jgi:hypothetical protein
MDFIFSKHVLEELERRGIPRSAVEAVLAAPTQKLPEHGDVICYQGLMNINQKDYLLRVMVNELRQPPLVVTVYRTSKIKKYWSQI